MSAPCTCQNCQSARATTRFEWPVTDGHQQADLCQACGAKWWAQYAHTPSGQGLRLSPIAAEVAS